MDDTRIYDERPIDDPTSADERRKPEPDLTSSVSDNTVRITAVQRTECRTTTTTPVEKEVGVGHSLHNGALAQALNLALAGALIAGGVAIYGAANSSSCTTTPNATPSNPNPSPVPCTTDQQQTQTAQMQGLGVLTVTAAVLPLGAFVWNIFRAQDDTKTEPTSPSVIATDWKTCATAPLVHRTITVDAGGTTVTGQTDDRGAATLDVSAIASAPTDPQNGAIHVDAGSHQAHETLSFSGTPAYASWKKAGEDARKQAGADAWAQAKRDYAEQQRMTVEAARQREEAALSQIDGEFAQLEQAPRWADADAKLFVAASESLTAIIKAHETGLPSRVAALVRRRQRIVQSPACKQRIAEVKQSETEQAAYDASPRGRCEATCHHIDCSNKGNGDATCEAQRISCFAQCQGMSSR